MGRLTLEQLRQTLQLREEEVDLPELDGTVLVRALTAHKRATLTDGLMAADGSIKSGAQLQARMFAASVVDPKVTPQDALDLAQRWPAQTWDRVMEKVNELSPSSSEVERSAEREFPAADE